MSAQPDSHKKRLPIEACLLLLLTLAFCAGFLRGDRMLLMPDLFSLEMPGYQMYREHLLAGSLPLWTPYSGCGEPYLAGSDIGVFYPVNLLFLAFSLPTAISVFAAFHLFLSAIATYWLCRLWRVTRGSSLLAAISFAFCSWSISRVEFLPTLATVSWFPINLAVFTLWLERRPFRYAVLLGGTLAMSLLAGWPEGTYYIAGSLLLNALVAGVQCFRFSKDWRQAVLPLGTVLFAGVLGLLLSAVQVLPTWKAVSLSQRAEGVQSGLADASVDPVMLGGLAIPSIYGLPTAKYRGEYWAPSCTEFYHGTFYLGVVPLVILIAAVAGLSLPSRRKDSDETQPSIRVPFLVLLTVFSLLYAMGDYTPVFPWLRNAIPIMQKFHGPAKSLMCFVLGLSCLSGIGLDRLISNESTPKRVLAMLAMLALAGICLFGLVFLGGEEILKEAYLNLASNGQPAAKIHWPVLGYETARFAVLVVLSSVLVLGLCIYTGRAELLVYAAAAILMCDLWQANRPLLVTADIDEIQLEKNESAFHAEVQPPGSSFRFQRPIRGHELYGATDPRLYNRARATMRGWWSSVDRAYNLTQCGPFRTKAVTDVLDLLDDTDVTQERKARLYAMLNCERVISPYEEPLYVTGRLNHLNVRHLKPSLPRAFVVGGIQVFPDDQAVIQELGFGDFDPREVALVMETDIPAESLERPSKGIVSHEVNRLEDGLNRLDLTVRADEAGLLVVSDTYYPGWAATVNGKDVPILRVNGGFRGISIPAGTSDVVFRYQPVLLRVGAAITGLTLSAILLAGLLGFWRFRRSKPAT